MKLNNTENYSAKSAHIYHGKHDVVTNVTEKTTAYSRCKATRGNGLSRTMLAFSSIMSLVQLSHSAEVEGESESGEKDYSSIISHDKEITLSVCIVFFTVITIAVIIFLKCCCNKKLCSDRDGVVESNSILSFTAFPLEEDVEISGRYVPEEHSPRRDRNFSTLEADRNINENDRCGCRNCQLSQPAPLSVINERETNPKPGRSTI
ncbi:MULTISPECIES: hypothetical protein [Candidatus Ichthyocystis]|uniref:Putative membrane protein n=1 Tax=Candidatus Ichthyocystis hellenicum TaxID=1561003 RepID=A0A0S4M3D9_9BURK|nr:MULTISPECIES: hypothetical protein [Ichthyocystis]CUT17744.1 putative membrane protein [Candidatus Ichthyocystis hellenicum]